MSVQLSPVLARLAQYPFTRLDDWKAEAVARGVELIDFGMGDPRERTPGFIRDALISRCSPNTIPCSFGRTHCWREKILIRSRCP